MQAAPLCMSQNQPYCLSATRLPQEWRLHQGALLLREADSLVPNAELGTPGGRFSAGGAE